MAHISSLSSGIFTYLDFHNAAPAASVDTAAEYAGLFVTANASAISRIPSVRQFPSIGTPANIVNVPVYGQNTSSQVQGQSDAPTLEVTVNYVPEDMDAFHALIGTQGAFRFMMCSQATTLAASLDTATTALTCKMEAILVNPALTDSTTATVTMSTQSYFFGPVTLP